MKRKLFENAGGNQFRLIKEDPYNTSVSVRNRELPGSDDRDNEYRDTRDYDAEDRAKAKEDDDKVVDENTKTPSNENPWRSKYVMMYKDKTGEQKIIFSKTPISFNPPQEYYYMEISKMIAAAH